MYQMFWTPGRTVVRLRCCIRVWGLAREESSSVGYQLVMCMLGPCHREGLLQESDHEEYCCQKNAGKLLVYSGYMVASACVWAPSRSGRSEVVT